MIITKTPFRISFFGGGSDIADFYSRSDGAVLSVTINKFMYISSHPFFHRDQLRVKYSQTETVNELEEIRHPIVKEVLRRFEINKGLEISSNADIPSGTGLGSSSAFTVGLLHNMYARKSQYVTKADLADEASDIEINQLREPIGKQDQFATAFGGLNIFKFDKAGIVTAEPIHLKKDSYKALKANLFLFYTGVQRATSTILVEQKQNMQNPTKVQLVKKMVDLVWLGRTALYAGDMDSFGRLLHEGWMLKREVASGVTDTAIDRIYNRGMAAGALGGKLLGAGGGGFLLFYCPQHDHERLRSAMSDLRELRFKFENEGSKVIYIGDEYEG